MVTIIKKTGISKGQWWLITLSFIICHLSFSPAGAQTFTQRVQQRATGEGVVTIHQDKSIESLVNGQTTPSTTSKTATTTTTNSKEKSTTKSATTKDSKASSGKSKDTASSASSSKSKDTASSKSKDSASSASSSKSKDTASSASSLKSKDTASSKSKDTATSSTSSKSKDSDTSRAVTPEPQSDTTQAPADPNDTTSVPQAPRHMMKVTGFRVQAFAGGNTRSDRQHAEHTGNVMRQLFPGTDVYVRFYSPRWVCRVGNYRTYEEAREVLLEIRNQGYESATIVKGKIVVPLL